MTCSLRAVPSSRHRTMRSIQELSSGRPRRSARSSPSGPGRRQGVRGWDLILIRVLAPGLVSRDWRLATWANGCYGWRTSWRPLRGRGTARLDGVWTKRGPGTPARGGSGACASRDLGLARMPAAAGQASPARAIALSGGAAGVWARDIPQCRRAVRGQRHGDTPTLYVFKPDRGRWLAGRHGRQTLPYQAYSRDASLVERGTTSSGASELAVVVRWEPRLTLRCGTWVARRGCAASFKRLRRLPRAVAPI